MHTEIKFKNKVAYHGKKWATATGIHMMAHDTIDVPSPNGIAVVNLTPMNRAGLGSTSIELPAEQLPEIMAEMMKVAGIDPIQAAKDVLVANGYVDDFTSIKAIELELQAMEEEVTPEQLEKVISYYMKDGIDIDRLENALVSIREDEEWLKSEEEDESDELRHVASQYTPDGQ